MSPKQPAPPFGLPINTRTAVEALHERCDATEQRITGVEGCMARLELEVREVKTTVELLRDFAIEDRQQRALALQESGKTERTRLNSRAKIVVSIVGVIGVIAGAAATVLAGCV